MRDFFMFAFKSRLGEVSPLCPCSFSTFQCSCHPRCRPGLWKHVCYGFQLGSQGPESTLLPPFLLSASQLYLPFIFSDTAQYHSAQHGVIRGWMISWSFFFFFLLFFLPLSSSAFLTAFPDFTYSYHLSTCTLAWLVVCWFHSV